MAVLFQIKVIIYYRPCMRMAVVTLHPRLSELFFAQIPHKDVLLEIKFI